jgi:hypothetical protein
MIEAKRGSSGPRRLQDRTRVLLQGEDFLRPIVIGVRRAFGKTASFTVGGQMEALEKSPSRLESDMQ